MLEYGYIEDGFLRAKEIEPIVHKYKDENTGEIKQYIISVEDQIAALPPQWKPVDPIDESKQETSRENYTVRIIPYDAGDRISYLYVEVPDLQKVKNEINTPVSDLGYETKGDEIIGISPDTTIENFASKLTNDYTVVVKTADGKDLARRCWWCRRTRRCPDSRCSPARRPRRRCRRAR